MALKVLILDTNILLDLLIFNDPQADGIRRGIEQHEFELIYSQEILSEYTDVIARPTFAKMNIDQSLLLNTWHQIATLKPSPPPCGFRCDDPDDQPFIDLAYHYRPSQLLSKDRKILQMQKVLVGHDVQIQSYLD